MNERKLNEIDNGPANKHRDLRVRRSQQRRSRHGLEMHAAMGREAVGRGRLDVDVPFLGAKGLVRVHEAFAGNDADQTMIAVNHREMTQAQRAKHSEM